MLADGVGRFGFATILAISACSHSTKTRVDAKTAGTQDASSTTVDLGTTADLPSEDSAMDEDAVADAPPDTGVLRADVPTIP